MSAYLIIQLLMLLSMHFICLFLQLLPVVQPDRSWSLMERYSRIQGSSNPQVPVATTDNGHDINYPTYPHFSTSPTKWWFQVSRVLPSLKLQVRPWKLINLEDDSFLFGALNVLFSGTDWISFREFFILGGWKTTVPILLPAPSKGCQMVPKGFQFTIP